MSEKQYKAVIKNIDKDTWVKNENDGEIEETDDFDEALVFYDWADAESILEYLNDEFSDCYQLIIL